MNAYYEREFGRAFEACFVFSFFFKRSLLRVSADAALTEIIQTGCMPEIPLQSDG